MLLVIKNWVCVGMFWRLHLISICLLWPIVWLILYINLAISRLDDSILLILLPWFKWSNETLCFFITFFWTFLGFAIAVRRLYQTHLRIVYIVVRLVMHVDADIHNCGRCVSFALLSIYHGHSCTWHHGPSRTHSSCKYRKPALARNVICRCVSCPSILSLLKLLP